MKKKRNHKPISWFLIILLLLFFCWMLSMISLFLSIVIVILIISCLIYLFFKKTNFLDIEDKNVIKKEELKNKEKLIINKREITKLIKKKEIMNIFNNHLNKNNFENFEIKVPNPNHQEFQSMGSVVDIFFKNEWINEKFSKELSNPKYDINFLNDFSKIKKNITENKLIENLLKSSNFIVFDKKFEKLIGYNLILGTADLIIDDCMIEIKTSLKSKIDITWIYQLLFYTILWENENFLNKRKINNIKILNTRAKNIINIPLNDLIYDLEKLKNDLFFYLENN